ncbi:MAG: hypothetical protein ACI92Z_002577 [Paracoccaceae bacterium]|jgi:hypothetical protein
MSVHFTRAGCAALILAFSSQSALADLTAKDVWSDWQSYISDMGYEMTGTQTMSGKTLKISDVGYTIAIPDEDVTISITSNEMSLIENGDGTVNITVPESQVVTIDVTVKDDEDAKIKLNYTQSGLVMVVSGEPGNVTYDYSAKSLGVSLDSIEIDGEVKPADMAKVSLAMNEIAGNTVMTTTDTQSSAGTMNIGSLTYDIAVNNPDGDETFEMSGKSENLTSTSNFVMPGVIDSSDMRAMLNAGFAFDGKFSFGAGSYTLKGVDDHESFSADGSSQGGAFQVAMDKTNLAYGFSVNDVSTAISSNELPFPVSFAIAKYGLKLNLPLDVTKELQDFAIALTLQNFTMSDMLWSIFDQAGTLPRDPATILVDLKGKARVLVDMFAPNIEEIMMTADGPPAELHALTLNNLLVSAAGAKLSGTGDFTFDNNDLETYDGMPTPTGTLNLKLIGVNGLMDKLVAMGLIGDQEVMGALMGMGMLAVPGEGEDTLISKIEMTPNGQIIANGQRIK